MKKGKHGTLLSIEIYVSASGIPDTLLLIYLYVY